MNNFIFVFSHLHCLDTFQHYLITVAKTRAMVLFLVPFNQKRKWLPICNLTVMLKVICRWCNLMLWVQSKSTRSMIKMLGLKEPDQVFHTSSVLVEIMSWLRFASIRLYLTLNTSYLCLTWIAGGSRWLSLLCYYQISLKSCVLMAREETTSISMMIVCKYLSHLLDTWLTSAKIVDDQSVGIWRIHSNIATKWAQFFW